MVKRRTENFKETSIQEFKILNLDKGNPLFIYLFSSNYNNLQKVTDVEIIHHPIKNFCNLLFVAN